MNENTTTAAAAGTTVSATGAIPAVGRDYGTRSHDEIVSCAELDCAAPSAATCRVRA
jgi:hypothetical protein